MIGANIILKQTIKLSLAAKFTCKIICEQFTLAYFTYSKKKKKKKKKKNMLGIKTLILHHLTTETLLLSQTRLSFKNREIANFYIISHSSDQRRLRRVCAFSLIRLSFKIRKIANFHIFSHLMRAAKSQARLHVHWHKLD